jgi:hypothetical protein
MRNDRQGVSFPSARCYYYHALGPILLENRITSSSLYLYHLTGQQLTDCTALHLAAIACLSGEPASQPHAQKKLQPFLAQTPGADRRGKQRLYPATPSARLDRLRSLIRRILRRVARPGVRW